MTKITAEHLARTAYVYIRQSTSDQLVHNKESQRRQYALADRARQLGWTGVEIVDDDLGRSGGGVARPGFDRLIGNLRRRRRRGARDRGLASRPQWPRLAYPDRVLWTGRHDHRRREPIRGMSRRHAGRPPLDAGFACACAGDQFD